MRLLPSLSLVASLFVVGCSTQIGETDAEPESSEDPLAATCSEPRAYIAVVVGEGCVEVAAERGRWVPSPLFEDGPPESNACIYSWTGEDGAPVDRTALYSFVRPFNTGSALTPSCEGGARVREDIVLEPIPDLDIFGAAGSIGCDVCGIVKDDRLWVVLPPDKVLSKQIGIPLTNGRWATFQINADPGVHAATVSLPPTEPGVAYVEGPVAIY